MKCEHCAASLGEGLFCAFCGTPRAFEGGARLVEALSIELENDATMPLIPYGARLPTTYSNLFSTAAAGQPTFQVHLVIGNSASASASRTLIRLVHPLERPGPRGGPQIQLTITIDATGALTIEAHEKGTQNVFRKGDFRVPVVTGKAQQ